MEYTLRQASIAAKGAALVDEPGGFAALNTALKRRGFALAAYLTEHDRHMLAHERHSDCEPCMNLGVDKSTDGAHTPGIKEPTPERRTT